MQQSPPSVIAVVPTFAPEIGLLERIRSLGQQVLSVIVVDDGSPDSSAVVLESLRAAGIEVVLQGENRGIAAALNVGTRRALDRGADYVLTLDQDSLLPDDYVTRALHAFAIAGRDPRVGVVCTDRVNGQPSIPGSYTPEGLGIVREAIQSGFLISKECFAECGLFDARLFIDLVDTEFCLRIARHGFVTVVGPGTDIAHSLGRQEPYRPFGRTVLRDGEPARYQYHPPFRRYYISRNTIDLYFRSLRTDPRWVLSSFRRELPVAIDTIISGPHRGLELLATTIGALHGLARHRGPLSPRLRRLLTPRR